MLMIIFVTRLNFRRSRSADIYYGQSKLRWYRCVLSCARNEPTLEAARNVAGRLFQTLCAAIEKRRYESYVDENLLTEFILRTICTYSYVDQDILIACTTLTLRSICTYSYVDPNLQIAWTTFILRLICTYSFVDQHLLIA